MSFLVRRMAPTDVSAAVGLQVLAFPPPFNQDYHWDPETLLLHIEKFPEGQLVAESEGKVIGTSSNTIIDEEVWQLHAGWYRSVGGPDLDNFNPDGSTLYGLDITVHPAYRRIGVGRSFYNTRYQMVKARGLVRYGTGCRMPDFRTYEASHPGTTIEQYAQAVVQGRAVDRTLTPMLRYDLAFLGVIRNYMPDFESSDSGALLEWKP